MTSSATTELCEVVGARAYNDQGHKWGQRINTGVPDEGQSILHNTMAVTCPRQRGKFLQSANALCHGTARL